MSFSLKLSPVRVGAAALAGVLSAFVPVLIPDVLASVFNGGGLLSGVNQAGTINGVASGDPETIIQNFIDVALTFLQIAALVVITVAGFYLILGFGSESAKDRAKNMIIYTIVGLIVVTLAKLIIDFFIAFGKGTPDEAIRTRVLEVLGIALSYLNLAGVVVIVVAGFYLILGFGSESAKDKAKNMIIYTIVGLIIVTIAQVIVDLAISLGSGATGSVAGLDQARAKIIQIMLTAINFLALFAVIALVVAGFYLVLSNGNDEAKDKAKKIVLYVIIGLIVVLFARVIVGFITTALN